MRILVAGWDSGGGVEAVQTVVRRACPTVLLMHGPYLMPRPGAPAPGSGFMPARGRLGRWRDRAAASLLMRVFRTGMPAFNQARAELGLAPTVSH